MSILKSPLINALLRFIYHSWSIINLIVTEKFIKRLRYSGVANLKIDELKFKMFSRSDDGIVDALYFKEKKYSELNEIRLFNSLAKSSKVILDLGANTGLYSIVSQLSNPYSKVFSFEPYSVNLNRLKRNLSLNGLLEKTTIIECAIGDSPSTIEFAVPENDQICDTLSADIKFTNKFYKKWISYKQIKVAQITLDDYISDQKLDHIDLIKIDVENYEVNVFKGAIKTLKQFSPIILVEIFVTPEKIEFYEKVLKPLGYNCYIILNDGIFRSNSLTENPDCRNYIFSKTSTLSEYLSFSNIDLMVKQLKPSN